MAVLMMVSVHNTAGGQIIIKVVYLLRAQSKPIGRPTYIHIASMQRDISSYV
jgi:hypothetical protein